MDDMEQKINSILGNPQMMSQLMSMAQSITQQSTNEAKQEQASKSTAQKTPQSFSGIDVNMLQKVAALAQQSNIDKNQQMLLKALGPYLSKNRIDKLEKAMRAAKIAGIATSVLSSGSILKLGR